MRTLLLSWVILGVVAPVFGQGIGPGATVPAVANLPGVGGSFWRSDLHVQNPGETAASFRVLLFPEIRGGQPQFEAMTSDSIAVPARGQMVLSNVVQTVFGLSDVKGAVSVISEGGNPLVVGSRTYTFGEDGGSYGQEVFGVLVRGTAWASGVREDASFRTNLGIFLPIEPVPSAQFTVRIRDNDGEIVAEGFMNFSHAGLIQRSLGAFGVGLLFDGTVEVECSDPDLVWYGYVSRVDQISDDPVYRPLRGLGF
jgi:hypothetical protein